MCIEKKQTFNRSLSVSFRYTSDLSPFSLLCLLWLILLRRGRARRAAGRRNIAVQRVVHDHAIGVETPTECSNGAFHPFDPSARQPIMIALVVERNDFVA